MSGANTRSIESVSIMPRDLCLSALELSKSPLSEMLCQKRRDSTGSAQRWGQVRRRERTRAPPRPTPRAGSARCPRTRGSPPPTAPPPRPGGSICSSLVSRSFPVFDLDDFKSVLKSHRPHESFEPSIVLARDRLNSQSAGARACWKKASASCNLAFSSAGLFEQILKIQKIQTCPRSGAHSSWEGVCDLGALF